MLKKSFALCMLAVILLPIIFMASSSLFNGNASPYNYAFLPLIVVPSIISASIGLYYNIKLLKVHMKMPYGGVPLVLNIALLVLFVLLFLLLAFYAYATWGYGNVA